MQSPIRSFIRQTFSISVPQEIKGSECLERLKTFSRNLQESVLNKFGVTKNSKKEPTSPMSSGRRDLPLSLSKENNGLHLLPNTQGAINEDIPVRKAVSSALDAAASKIPLSKPLPSVLPANKLKLLKTQIALAKTEEDLNKINGQVETLASIATKAKNQVLDLDGKSNLNPKERQSLIENLAELDKVKWLFREKQSMIEGQKKFKRDPLTTSPEKIADELYASKSMKWASNPGDIIRKVSLKNNSITKEDLEQLKLLGAQKKENPITNEEKEFNELCVYAEALSKEINDSIDRRVGQLGILIQVMKDNSPPTSEEVAKLKIQYHQMIHNPFEVPLSESLIHEKLRNEDRNCIDNIKKSKVTLHPVMVLRAKREGLSRIREINQAKVGSQKREVLISGGGPVGLTLALSTEIMGHQYQLVETRGKDYFTYQADLGRHNIIGLGIDKDARALVMLSAQEREKPADVEIMNFFGIRDELLISERAQEGGLGGKDLDVEITDLQHSMLKSLALLKEELNPPSDGPVLSREAEREVEKSLSRKVDDHLDKLMTLNSQIETLHMDEKGEGLQIIIKNKENGSISEAKPDVVFVSEGSGSSTRSKLGIERTEISKTVKVAVGVFEESENKTTQSTPISTIIQSRIKLAGVIGKTILQTIKKSISDAAGVKTRKIVDPKTTFIEETGRFVLLGQNVDKDYTYASLKEAESAKLKTLQQEASLINPKLIELENAIIKKYEGKIEKTAVDQFKNTRQTYARKNVPLRIEVSQKLLTEIKEKVGEDDKDFEHAYKLLKALQNNSDQEEKLLRTVSEETRRYFKPISKYIVGHYVEGKKEFMFSSPVDVQLTRAETNHVQLGNTSVVLAGDTVSTTDPASGSGARTGILQTHIAQTTFLSPHLSANSSARAEASGVLSTLTDSMREEGLAQRAKYHVGTEKTQRFVDLAIRHEALSEDDGKMLLLLKKKGISDSKDLEALKQIKGNIQVSIKKQFAQTGHELSENPIKAKHLDGLPLRSQEKEVVAELLQKLLNPTESNKSMTKTEMDILRDIVGPWALDYRGGTLNATQASLVYLAGQVLLLESLRQG